MPRLLPAVSFCLAVTACGSNKDQPSSAPDAAASSAAASSAAASSSAAIPDAPPSPLSVVLESRGALTFSGLEGGVWISDESKTHVAQAGFTADLVASAMPEGLPSGAGRILGVSGRFPRSLWLSYEKQKDDGKPEGTPLFRLNKDQWKLIADDWHPEISAWSEGRLLSASTSALKLKIKVIEPSAATPPKDLPAARLNDEACDKTLHLEKLSALPSGAVFAAGSCKLGSSSSPARYVAIRWIPASTLVDGGGAASAAPPLGSASASASPSASAGPSAAPPRSPPAEDGGEGVGEARELGGPPGVVDVLPGATARARSVGLVARSAALAVTAAIEGEGKHTPVSRLWRFDGAAWAEDTLPATSQLVRSVTVTDDGTLWLLTEHEIWKRAAAAAWEAVPPPTRAFPEPLPSWEFFAVWASGSGDVWIAARHTSSTAKRDAILRLKAPKEVLRWQ